MAELDYAYLADYAQIESGKISALGASYTHAVVQSLNDVWLTTIAGRIRADEGEGPVAFGIKISPPHGGYELNYGSTVSQGDEFRAYRGKVGLLFTVTVQIPLLQTGLYTVDIEIEGTHARRLAFDVEVSEAR